MELLEKLVGKLRGIVVKIPREIPGETRENPGEYCTGIPSETRRDTPGGTSRRTLDETFTGTCRKIIREITSDAHR